MPAAFAALFQLTVVTLGRKRDRFLTGSSEVTDALFGEFHAPAGTLADIS